LKKFFAIKMFIFLLSVAMAWGKIQFARHYFASMTGAEPQWIARYFIFGALAILPLGLVCLLFPRTGGLLTVVSSIIGTVIAHSGGDASFWNDFWNLNLPMIILGGIWIMVGSIMAKAQRAEWARIRGLLGRPA
jgi:hypothetical protein